MIIIVNVLIMDDLNLIMILFLLIILHQLNYQKKIIQLELNHIYVQSKVI